MKPSDSELIAKAKLGNTHAFQELIYRYDKRVLILALSFTRNEEDAKDIFQDVFIRAYKSLSRFEERSDFMTWLHKITSNVCLTFISEKSHRQTETISESIAEYAQSLTVQIDVQEKLASALLSLSPQQRMAFLLKHEEGYKIKEIALMLNCSEGTIKRHLFDATHRLKKILTEDN